MQQPQAFAEDRFRRRKAEASGRGAREKAPVSRATANAVLPGIVRKGMAERGGFEPPRHFCLHDFQSCTFDQLGHLSAERKDGGEGGIRTHGGVAASTVFETARFNHSRTSPPFLEELAKQISAWFFADAPLDPQR